MKFHEMKEAVKLSTSTSLMLRVEAVALGHPALKADENLVKAVYNCSNLEAAELAEMSQCQIALLGKTRNNIPGSHKIVTSQMINDALETAVLEKYYS